MLHGLTPVYIRIGHKPIEHILTGTDKGIHDSFLLLAPGVPYPESGEKQKNLKDGKQSVHAVALAPDSKSVLLGHLVQRKGLCECVHCVRHIIFLKNVLISEINGVNLCIDIALSMFLFGTLNLLILYQLGKKPCRFLCLYLYRSVLAKLELII